MSLPHETAARSIYPSARHFQPVVIDGQTEGWTFTANLVSEPYARFLWISKDHEVTADFRVERDGAAQYLAEYLEYKKGSPSQSAEATVV